MASWKGHFLLSSIEMLDPNFAQTVVLIAEHNEEGAFGLVLNRATETSVQAAWEQVGEGPCLMPGVLHQGGPCPGPLTLLHTDTDRGDLDVVEGVVLTQHAEHIKALMAEGAEPVRCLVGYSGWGPGQLESEMEQQAWVTLEADRETIFLPTPRQWIELLRLAAPDQAQALRRERRDRDDGSDEASSFDQTDPSWN